MSAWGQAPPEKGDAQGVTAIRREPVQGRSQETVQRILAAASKLLEGMPVEQLTTSRIAQACAVSIGGLYRFFPDKQSIIDAIAVQHVRAFEGQVRNRMPFLLPLGGTGLLGAVIDQYIEFLDVRPDFRAIVFGRHISAATREEQIRPDFGTAGLIRQAMIRILGIKDSEKLSLKVRIATETGERLLAFAYEHTDVEDRRRIVAELKTLLAGYLFG